MKIIDVSIEGISPLLQNRYIPESERLKGTTPTSKKRTGIIDRSQEWKTCLYQDEKGRIYQPSTHLESAMIRVASNFQIPGRGKKTYKDLFKCAVFVKPDAIPHDGMNGSLEQMLKKGLIKINTSTVIINRSRVEKLRPQFDKWSLDFQIELHDEQIPFEVVAEILEYAGRYNGLGDWRPRFGRFIVAKFEERKESEGS